ncbi:nuclear transport factor 2 family protein [Brevibacillus dissolubilis]|uniref:nuclear transport factor 2 family protein n=1 Tax=Brevibacillus dissolubilis TaxID=1844116 RepID=UPI001115C41E|nr:nuclear transport factor 2 family protein [Brevibacillus dissolubilis]
MTISYNPNENPVYIVQKQLDAYNAQDIDAFMATYTEDVEIYNFKTGELLYSGQEKMRASYAKMFQDNPNNHAEITNRTVQGNYVIDQELVTGRAGREPYTAVAIYEVQDGLIKRVSFI